MIADPVLDEDLWEEDVPDRGRVAQPEDAFWMKLVTDEPTPEHRDRLLAMVPGIIEAARRDMNSGWLEQAWTKDERGIPVPVVIAVNPGRVAEPVNAGGQLVYEAQARDVLRHFRMRLGLSIQEGWVRTLELVARTRVRASMPYEAATLAEGILNHLGPFVKAAYAWREFLPTGAQIRLDQAHVAALDPEVLRILSAWNPTGGYRGYEAVRRHLPRLQQAIAEHGGLAPLVEQRWLTEFDGLNDGFHDPLAPRSRMWADELLATLRDEAPAALAALRAANPAYAAFLLQAYAKVRYLNAPQLARFLGACVTEGNKLPPRPFLFADVISNYADMSPVEQASVGRALALVPRLKSRQQRLRLISQHTDWISKFAPQDSDAAIVRHLGEQVTNYRSHVKSRSSQEMARGIQLLQIDDDGRVSLEVRTGHDGVRLLYGARLTAVPAGGGRYTIHDSNIERVHDKEFSVLPFHRKELAQAIAALNVAAHSPTGLAAAFCRPELLPARLSSRECLAGVRTLVANARTGPPPIARLEVMLATLLHRAAGVDGSLLTPERLSWKRQSLAEYLAEQAPDLLPTLLAEVPAFGAGEHGDRLLAALVATRNQTMIDIMLAKGVTLGARTREAIELEPLHLQTHALLALRSKIVMSEAMAALRPVAQESAREEAVRVPARRSCMGI